MHAKHGRLEARSDGSAGRFRGPRASTTLVPTALSTGNVTGAVSLCAEQWMIDYFLKISRSAARGRRFAALDIW